ncbi:MAG: flavodoxin family protein [Acidobacteria bacterium]|nr:flavodoxin family protein [Acidobacteriota bacterium]
MKTLLSFLMGWTMCVAPGLAQPEEPDQINEVVRTRVLVAYYSETGNTEALGRALVEGMTSVAGVEPVFRKVSEASDDDIRRADGILIGTPVYWASLHARVKEFIDRVGRVLDQEIHGEGRTAGAFCTGGAAASGKELARLTILAAFLNMRFVIIGGLEVDGFGTLGAEATTGPADPGLSEQEIEAARRSGARFARITAELAQARSN